MAALLRDNEMSTAATPLKKVEEYDNPNVNKVVVSGAGLQRSTFSPRSHAFALFATASAGASVSAAEHTETGGLGVVLPPAPGPLLSTVDRPVTADRSSPAGAFLGRCLARSDVQIPDGDAYQAGAYAALENCGVRPNWIAGTAIGAVNAAIIAGNLPHERIFRLRQFWQELSRRVALGGERGLCGKLHQWLAGHIPSRRDGDLGHDRPGVRPSELRELVEGAVDFDRVNSGSVRIVTVRSMQPAPANTNLQPASLWNQCPLTRSFPR